MNAFPFLMTKDTPTDRVWQWGCYAIQWEPLPDDGSWAESWEYLLTSHRERYAVYCGFSTVEAAAAWAVEDDRNCVYLETHGTTMHHYDKEIGAWVEKQL